MGTLGVDLVAVNTRFVEEHLAHRWLDFAEVGEWVYPAKLMRSIARRRGVEVVQHPGSSLFYRGGQLIGGLSTMRPSINGVFAATVCSSKHLTKVVLERAGLPTPRGERFGKKALADAEAFFQGVGGKAVVKPLDGSQGEGVRTGVSSAIDFREAWESAIQASKTRVAVVEEEVPGVDIRVYVVGGKAVAAAARIPPFVVGDGASTLTELLERLRLARSSHSYLDRLKLVPDDSMLAREGVEGGTVLGDGVVQFLNGTANLSRGGVPVDVTDTLPDEVLRLAEDAVSQVPDLGAAGVDILMPDVTSVSGASIIEINVGPNPLVHDMPAYGRPRGVTESVIDELISRGSF